MGKLRELKSLIMFYMVFIGLHGSDLLAEGINDLLILFIGVELG